MGSFEILWRELIDEWRLSQYEVAYIDRQQGFHCSQCHSSLRSMALARAVMRCFGYSGLFKDFVKEPATQKLQILEVNEAGTLTQFLSQCAGHTLKSYPELDLMNMPYKDESFDLVIHSDTLEHVELPVRGLSECYRVLKPNGYCAYTIPMVVDRLTSSRKGLPPSYHGGKEGPHYLVYTEYGCDAWKEVIQAGFQECRIVSLEYPSAQVFVGVK